MESLNHLIRAELTLNTFDDKVNQNGTKLYMQNKAAKCQAVAKCLEVLIRKARKILE